MRRTFNPACTISRSCSRARVSRLKVENVVKDPSIPMKRKVFHPGVREFHSARLHRSPIVNDPRALTVSVPYGKVEPNAL